MIAALIALVITGIGIKMSLPSISALGPDAGKLIFLLTCVVASVGFVFCLIKDHNTIIEIKTWWWEFLAGICFWVAVTFGYLYLNYDEYLDDSGRVRDRTELGGKVMNDG